MENTNLSSHNQAKEQTTSPLESSTNPTLPLASPASSITTSNKDAINAYFNEFKYMSAPMEDITDSVFRTLCHKYGADLTFTEMVRVEALAKRNAATWSRLDFPDSTPTVVQLLVSKEEPLKRFLEMFKPTPGFVGFNINLGCPSPQIVQIGQGCALIKRIARVNALVNLIKQAGYPVSIKMRLGLNRYEKEKKAYINLITQVDADFFIVHARHGAQTYADVPDYGVYPECVKTGKIIVANGDFDTKEKIALLKKMGVKGVMIGRSAVFDPSIFAKVKEDSKIEIPSPDVLKQEYRDLCKQFNSQERYQGRFFAYFGNQKLKATLSNDEKKESIL